MNQRKIAALLEDVRRGKCKPADAAGQLSALTTPETSDACLDYHRRLRTGIPEVIYGESKTAGQIITIAKNMQDNGSLIIATRVGGKKAAKIQKKLAWLKYHRKARMLTGNIPDKKTAGRGPIAVVSAGTSDLPIAEEAAVTLESLGHQVSRIYDVGVAGLHRILSRRKVLRKASVIIVAAGMEGALPSVVGGLVSCPVVAVPTSVGYGASFGGLSALLGMLNSCVPGVAVVNIDNGFGAACMAAAINQK
ncbi:MAG: 1-(5-phosphoribosyl)-5-amino-4-imidazole-carboxylate carboxylase [Deltaproteobacteria bacterium]|nr:MAG: 1-(5-phosphoribosyl)-5-amino-4-imidazole-carboxylate carboxylase [Deltaproteobacteria bacterium]